MAEFPGTSTSPRDFKDSKAREGELVLTQINFAAAAASRTGFLVRAEINTPLLLKPLSTGVKIERTLRETALFQIFATNIV